MIQWEVGINATNDPLEFVADVFAALLEGRAFGEPLMALYRQYGGPTP